MTPARTQSLPPSHDRGQPRPASSRVVPRVIGCLTIAAIVAATVMFTRGRVASAEPAAPGTGHLVFLGNRNIAPVVYLDQGAPTGVAVALTRAVARHLGQPVDIRATDWAEAQRLVAEGQADALIQINPTPERLLKYEFSEPLLLSEFSIFVRTDRVGISDLQSLRGLRVGVEAAGLPRQTIGKDPEIAVTIIPNFLTGFQLLQRDSLDAVVVDYRVGSYVLAENRIRGIKATGKPIASSWSTIAVRKGNLALLDRINRALQTIKADGTYERIIEEWRPKEVVYQTREQIARRFYLTAIVTLLTLFVIALLWIFTIRTQLRKRHSTEARMRTQYATLRSLIDATDAPIFSVDRQYHYTTFNKAHADLMKALYGADIEVGHSLTEYMTAEADRTIARQNLERALAGEHLVEESCSGQEVRARRYFQVTHSPIRSESGEVIGAAMVAHEITGRKRAEEQVRQLNERLEHRVKERTAQLEQALRELESFSYSVSHDLRAPLRTIDGFSRLLMTDYGTKIDDEGKADLQRIRNATQRMAQLIDAMLRLSRLNRTDLTMTNVDLSKVATEVVTELRATNPSRVAEVVITPGLSAWGDPSLLRVAMENVLGNAWKYTSRKPATKIEFHARDEDGSRVYSVRDNGCGFDMQYADKLFGPFKRLHTAEEYPGTGVGLASVQRVIFRHGGRVWIDSRVDEGTTLSFTLPPRPPAV